MHTGRDPSSVTSGGHAPGFARAVAEQIAARSATPLPRLPAVGRPGSGDVEDWLLREAIAADLRARHGRSACFERLQPRSRPRQGWGVRTDDRRRRGAPVVLSEF